MILGIIVSILIGILIPILYNKSISKALFFGKYHIHHTLHGVFLVLMGILMIDDFISGRYFIGFGVGLIIHHLFSEKNLKLISLEEDYLFNKKTKLVKYNLKKK